MRKIRLSDTDLELFDIEISPTDYTFYQRHKDAFKTMWPEQGKYFWIRFVITFRSFTIKHGVIKQMNIDSPKFQNLIDQAFIFIHEQFVDGKVSAAKNFLEDCALLAQNQDKFPGLDSKSFSKDPFYARETRELFRKFFGMPDQKTSYLKVYILSPVYLRFGGSVCRCLIRWVDADNMDPKDDSYWIQPQPIVNQQKSDNHDTCQHSMCTECNLDAESKFMCEVKDGIDSAPVFLDWWTHGDPRFNVPGNPLFAPHLNPKKSWRASCSMETYREFYQYTKIQFGGQRHSCTECYELRRNCERLISAYRSTKKKAKKEGKEIGDLTEAQLLGCTTCTCHHHNTTNAQPEPIFTNTKPKDPSPPPAKKKKEKKMKEDNKSSKDKKPTEKTNTTDKTNTNKNTSTNKPTTDKPATEKSEVPERGSVFNSKTSVTNDFEYPMPTVKGDGLESKIAGFKVIKIEDEENGLFEVNVSVTSIKPNAEEKAHTESLKKKLKEQLLNNYILTADLLRERIEGMPRLLEWWEGRGYAIAVLNYEAEEKQFTEVPDAEEKAHTESLKKKLKEQLLNNYILTADLLRERIQGMPRLLEWWEGRGYAIAVLNYEAEEKQFTQKWSNFALKISGYDEVPIKQMMMKLLFYVAKRKRRPCHGWCMEVDDVVTCMLPEDTPRVEDLSISIQRGFRFEDRLTDDERDSLLKHQPNLRLDKVLMGMEPGDLTRLFAEKGGHDKFKIVCEAVLGRDLFYGEDPPYLDFEKLRKKISTEEYQEQDIKHDELLMEQGLQDPDNFEFYVLMEKTRESGLWQYGLKTMDIRYYMANKNPAIRICPVCKIVGEDCTCLSPMVVPPDVVKFMEKTDFQEVKLLGDTDGPELPKMSYKELNSFSMDEKDKDKENKKRKKGESKKVKDKKIELSDLPMRFKHVGIEAEKTTISIPANADTPLIGKVPIELNDKADKMAPIPGLTSSLNFTFQNGRKEQTITVSLGAYMPEEKLNAIAEHKELSKIYSEEDKRLEKTCCCKNPEKKKKKRNKASRLRNAANKRELLKSPKSEEDQSTKEKNAEMTAMFLTEIIGRPNSEEAEKQLNAHLGLSHKKLQTQKSPSIWSKYEEPQDFSDIPKMTWWENGDKQKTTDEGSSNKEKENDKDNGQKDVNEKGDSQNTTSDKDAEDKVNNTGDGLKLGNTTAVVQENSDGTMIDSTVNQNGKAEVSEGVEVAVGEESAAVREDKDGSPGEGETRSDLRTCWNCQQVEPRKKAFKKCQKCKEEGVVNSRYYCGRDCQVADWKLRHKNEHKDGELK